MFSDYLTTTYLSKIISLSTINQQYIWGSFYTEYFLIQVVFIFLVLSIGFIKNIYNLLFLVLLYSLATSLFLSYYQLELFGLVLALAEILAVTFVFMVAVSYHSYDIHTKVLKFFFVTITMLTLLLVSQEVHKGALYYSWSEVLGYYKNDLMVIYIVLYIINPYSIFIVVAVLFLLTFLIMHGVTLSFNVIAKKKTKSLNRDFVFGSQKLKSQRVSKGILFKTNNI